jgi:predicted ester cyclase
MTTNSFPTVLRFLALTFFISYSATLFSQSNLSKNTNKEVVQKYLDIFNKHNLSEIDKVFATDYIWHTLDGREIHSLQDSSHIVTLRSVLRAIPDIHYTIESIISEGDVVAVNSTVTGTTQSPSGKKTLRFKQMFFFRVTGGQIEEEWEVLDTDLMMKQMGRKCE